MVDSGVVAHVEVVHTDERVGMLELELVPRGQVRARELAGKPLRIAGLDVGVDVESHELELELREGPLDLLHGKAVLLHMEQQITTAARVIEILELDQGAERSPPILQLQVEPEATNVLSGRRVAELSGLPCSCSDIASRQRAVESDPHDSTGPQQGPKHAPSP